MSDVFVLPSLFEGLPITLIEAQCTGLPCLISSNVTSEANLGLVKILELKTNLWKDSIINIDIEDESKRSNSDAIIYNHNYSLEQTIKVLEELYRKCLK